MTWRTPTSWHEGFAALRFSDGAVGMAWHAREVVVSEWPQGREPVTTEPDHRPGSAISSWQPRCTYGWRGHPWNRVEEPWDMDVAARLAYTAGIIAPVVVRDLYQQWLEHTNDGSAPQHSAATED